MKTFIPQTYSLSERYDFSIIRRKENIQKTEPPEHNVISILEEQVHFASHSVCKGMSWNKIWRSKGFVFPPMTLSLNGEGKRRNEFAEWHVTWLAV